MDLQLKGKRALVTGSSSGIGEAIARVLAAEGARSSSRAGARPSWSASAAEILEAGGMAAVAVGDLGTDAGADAVVEAATRAFDGLDILVNNAGAFPMVNWFDGPADAWNDLYNQNVGSMVRMIGRLVPALRRWAGAGSSTSPVASGWSRAPTCRPTPRPRPRT